MSHLGRQADDLYLIVRLRAVLQGGELDLLFENKVKVLLLT